MKMTLKEAVELTNNDEMNGNVRDIADWWDGTDLHDSEDENPEAADEGAPVRL